MNTSTSQSCPAPDADAQPTTLPTVQEIAPQPSQEPRPDSDPATESRPDHEEPAPTTPPLDIEALISQARHEGYIRGRNEQIAASMNAPALFENPSPQPSGTSLADGFLSAVRPSVWD